MTSSTGNPEQDSVVIAILASFVLQWAKESKLRFLRTISPETARFFSAVLATFAAAGISLSYSPSAGSLTIEGLTVSGIASFLWLTAKQFVMQDVAFRLGIKLPNSLSRSTEDRKTGEVSVSPGDSGR